MRHQKKTHRLGRPTDQRKALLRSLATEVLRRGTIETTLARAKAVSSVVDKLITLGKRGDLHARRQALAFVYDEDVVRTLFSNVAARFQTRPGGFTRVVKTGFRRGDAAPMAVIELTELNDVQAKTQPAAKAAKAPKPKAEKPKAEPEDKAAKAAKAPKPKKEKVASKA